MKGEKNMFKLKNSLVALAGLTGLVGIITLVTPAAGQGQGGNNQHPLNVNVVNLPTRTPVQFSAFCSVSFPETNCESTLYTVPDGMRLVIEHVALVSDTLVTGNAIQASVLTQPEVGNTLSHHLDLRAQAPVEGTLFVANHPILAFAGPGKEIRLTAILDQPQGSPGSSFNVLRGTLSGYLESIP